MDKILRQFNEEKRTFQEREMEVLQRYSEMEIECRKNLSMMEEKYKSVKKTLLNYKNYSEEKEQHMLKEYDRIKEGYQAAKTKMQNQLEDALERQRKKYEDRITQLEAERKVPAIRKP
jgi:asterless protein